MTLFESQWLNHLCLVPGHQIPACLLSPLWMGLYSIPDPSTPAYISFGSCPESCHIHVGFFSSGTGKCSLWNMSKLALLMSALEVILLNF